MLSIGEFSKICKVSTKTLRYYAEIAYSFSLDEIKKILYEGCLWIK